MMLTESQEMLWRNIIREHLLNINEAVNPSVAIALIGLIPSFAMMSDKRLKYNIVLDGISPSGLNIYEFSFEPEGPRYRGVIAQEVKEINPDAVVINSDGYYAVIYDDIDVDFESISAEEY